MPYLNLDDEFADHPKVDALSDGAFRLHVSGLCYAAKNLTDGLIECRRVPRLMPEYRPALLKELTDAGMWHAHKDGYEIHDYLDWNKSREWWEAERARKAKNKADWYARKHRKNGAGPGAEPDG